MISARLIFLIVLLGVLSQGCSVMMYRGRAVAVVDTNTVTLEGPIESSRQRSAPALTVTELSYERGVLRGRLQVRDSCEITRTDTLVTTTHYKHTWSDKVGTMMVGDVLFSLVACMIGGIAGLDGEARDPTIFKFNTGAAISFGIAGSMILDLAALGLLEAYASDTSVDEKRESVLAVENQPCVRPRDISGAIGTITPFEGGLYSFKTDTFGFFSVPIPFSARAFLDLEDVGSVWIENDSPRISWATERSR